jgi:murein DD-endopeptidase MepM/ murein hydrolase activator NlpD
MAKGNERGGWMAAGLFLVLLAGVFVWLGNPSRRLPQVAAAEELAPAVVEAKPAPEVKAAVVPAPELKPLAEDPPPEPEEEGLLRFGLPTDNDGLLSGRPEQFYMFVDRYTPAGQVQVWEGGSYGFVRNPRVVTQGTVYTKFHEGIDIAPVRRDAAGEPLDEVRAVADGTVAYVTGSAKVSNYGNYVVVLHQIGKAGVYYSLYAHLRSIAAQPGVAVRRGEVLGVLGHTGAGIDRRRAHVHLEMGIVLSERYELGGGGVPVDNGGHGNFHGENLAGFNAGAFLAANHKDPKLMPDRFLQQQEVYYKVQVPNRGGELDLAGRYPWLRRPGAAGASWEISFTGPGLPVAIAPSATVVPFATVSWVKPYSGYHSWNTRSILGGTGNTATLSNDGQRHVKLVTGDF